MAHSPDGACVRSRIMCGARCYLRDCPKHQWPTTDRFNEPAELDCANICTVCSFIVSRAWRMMSASVTARTTAARQCAAWTSKLSSLGSVGGAKAFASKIRAVAQPGSAALERFQCQLASTGCEREA